MFGTAAPAGDVPCLGSEKVQALSWQKGVGKGSAALVATWPRFASYSFQRLEGILKVLHAENKIDKLAGALTLD